MKSGRHGPPQATGFPTSLTTFTAESKISVSPPHKSFKKQPG